MQPRSSTSKKWTTLPPELAAQMRTVLAESFKSQLGNGQVTADGRIYPDEILLVVGISRPKTLAQVGWEISIKYRVPKDNVLKLLHLGMDAAGALFEQLFANADDADFPLLWQKVDFEGREIYVQYTTTNSTLEAEADKWLGKLDEDGLVKGDWEEDLDPDLIKAQLGIDPIDADDGDADDDGDPGDEDDEPKGRA